MKIISLVLLSLSLLLNSKEVTAANYHWKLFHEVNRVKVYVRDINRNNIVEFKGITRISASIDSILAVLRDHPACPDWFHHCDRAEIIQEVSFNERYHYQQCSLPFLIKKRDFIFHSFLTQNPLTQTFVITLIAKPDYCIEKTSSQCSAINSSTDIRVRSAYGYILMEPLKDGTTRVTWNQHTDPGGMIPTLLINQLAQDVPLRSLSNLREIVQERKYQQSRLIYDHRGIAVNLITPDIEHKKNFVKDHVTPQQFFE